MSADIGNITSYLNISSNISPAVSISFASQSPRHSKLQWTPFANVEMTGLQSPQPQDPNSSDHPQIASISHFSNLITSSKTITPFQKRALLLLLQIPRGRYTTYKHMSDFLSASPRAVGNAMRNNPFAPDVPCHRVLASDRSIGGFKGSWKVDGQKRREGGRYSGEKIGLLRREGVKFDGRGKAVGRPFDEFSRDI